MNTGLCDRFPALDPFAVRAKRYHDVLLIFMRLKGQADRKSESGGKSKTPAGSFVCGNTLFVPAQGDDWY